VGNLCVAAGIAGFRAKFVLTSPRRFGSIQALSAVNGLSKYRVQLKKGARE
jgi:hypothetical protein